MLGFFIALASCRKTISEVFQGNWTASVTYTTKRLPYLNVDFYVQKDTGANFLITTFEDELVNINLSYVDLSGNITYKGEVYDFNFTMKAPPFVSSDIDFREMGLMHIALASYTNIHVTMVDGKDTIVLTVKKQIPVVTGNLLTRLIAMVKSKGRVIVMGAAFVIVQLVFKHFTNKLSAKTAREIAEKRALEQKQKEEQETKEAEEKQENGEEEEAKEPVKKELVADETGKVKNE